MEYVSLPIVISPSDAVLEFLLFERRSNFHVNFVFPWGREGLPAGFGLKEADMVYVSSAFSVSFHCG